MSLDDTHVRRMAGSLTSNYLTLLLDAIAWTIAIIFALVLRYDFDVLSVSWRSTFVLCLVVVAFQLLAGWVSFLYRGRHPVGSFAELQALVGAVVLVGVAAGVPTGLWGNEFGLPRSTLLIAAPVALILMGAVRYAKRLISEKSMRPHHETERALVYGAGYLGSSIVRRMLTDRNSPYTPVGLIDDDRRKRNVWLDGVRVLGTRDDLASIAEATDAQVLVVTIATADSAFLREILDVAVLSKLKVKVLPPLEDVLEGKSRLRDLRDISIEDLIGRQVINTEIESIADYVTGKRVLVTGAGGSIGSELCRQIHKFAPAELIMLDHDETGMQMAQVAIIGNGLLDNTGAVLADIREADVIGKIFRERRPEVVFHAAALKHLPMLESFPDEGWKTNVLGTLNVLNAAIDVGVTTFVNVSTDKAANPTSILGHSKRVAEKLTSWAAQESNNRYLSVRFGNVIGSRGSMLPTFASLIAAGGPLTVTHPEMTRYFMTIPEACQLVIQAGAIGRPGEVLILDMGEPVKIIDIARRMIEMSGQDIAIVYTGLRHGEKIHEELIGVKESDERPIHPKISHAQVNPIDPSRLDKAGWDERCRSENSSSSQERQ